MLQLNSDEIRVIGLAGPALISMLRVREERVIARMYGAFRNGERDHLTAVAELACIRGIIEETETAIRQLQQEKPK